MQMIVYKSKAAGRSLYRDMCVHREGGDCVGRTVVPTDIAFLLVVVFFQLYFGLLSLRNKNTVFFTTDAANHIGDFILPKPRKLGEQVFPK